MKGVKRRIMAFALAFAMVLGVCSGYSIGANAEEENTGLVAAWDGGWENGIPQKNTDESKYSSWFGCAIRQDITIYIGKSMNEKLSVQDAENISVTKDGQLLDGFEIIPFSYYDNQKNKDVNADNGFFNVRFDEIGEYVFSLGDNYLTIDAGLPEIGVYTGTEFSMENLVTDNGNVMFSTEEESVYYVGYSKKDSTFKFDETKTKAVRFEEKFDGVNVEFLSDSSMIKITVPNGTKDFFDLVYEGTVTYPAVGEAPAKTEKRSRRFFFNPIMKGFVIAEPDWRNDGPHFRNNVDGYFWNLRASMLENRTICLAWIDDEGNIGPIDNINKLTIKYNDAVVYNDEFIDDDKIEFANNSINGLYDVRFKELGTYRIIFDAGLEDESYVDINVVLPEVAIYSTNEAKPQSLVGVRDQWFNYVPGEKYYLIWTNAKDYDGGEVCFDPELQMEKIEEWDGSPIEITIPATMVGSPWDGIIVNLKDKYGGTDERKFPLVGSENGIQIGDTDRSRDDNNVECEMAISPDAEDDHGNSRFSKDRGMAIFYENCVTLGYNDGVETTILDEDELENLKIVDAAGNEVSSSVAKIEMYSYFWYYDEDQKKDIYFQSHDVFAIRIYKTGSYRLAYEKPIGQDDVEVTMAAINANLGDISIYSKPVADEKVIVGGDNTTYGDDRRTFYIVPYEEFSDEYKRVIEIVSKVKANSSEAKVEILDGTNIIKVTVDEDATDDIGVQVSYKQTESWYHEEEDEWVLDENPDDDRFENPKVREFNRYFMFNASGVVIPDSETLVSDKYQASLIDGMVKELPDADKFTVNDMEKYVSVCESYNALTLLQREFVKAETLDKLERIDSSILQGLIAKNELSNMLKPLLEKETVDLDDKDAVEEIYNKYNELTDAQKTFVDANDANAIKICKTVIDSIISTKDRVSSIIDFEFDKKYDECREAEQETLSNIRSNALDDIEDAKTVSELNQILDDALQNIEQVPTDADLNKDDAVNKKINSTLSDVEDYKQDVDKLKADINAADFISEEDKTAAINDLNNYFQDVNSKCDSLKNLPGGATTEEKEELLAELEESINVLNLFYLWIHTDYLSEKQLAEFKELAAKEKEDALDEAATEKEKAVNDAIAAAAAQLEAAVKSAKAEGEAAGKAAAEAAAKNAAATATPAAAVTPAASAKVPVGTVIKDTASAASYKVVKAGDKDITGAVEFIKPDSDANKKFTVPSTITSDGVTYEVTSIGDGAFLKNKKLTDVVISDKVQKIGKNAFKDCKSLKKIQVKTSVLTEVGANALKGINKKAVIKVPKKKKDVYKVLFKKKGQKKSVKVK